MVEGYIAQKGTLHDIRSFVAVPEYPSCSSFLHKNHAQQIVTDAFCEKKNYGGARESSEFRVASSKMYIPFVRCAERVGSHRQLETLLANWWRDKNIPTVSEVSISRVDEDWSQLSLIFKRRYWACKQYFETRLRMWHDWLVGSYNVESFSLMTNLSAAL